MVRKQKPITADQRLEAKIRKAKLVLLWEQVWVAIFPLLCVVGAFVLAAISGILEYLPREAHYAALGLFLVGLGIAIRPLFSIRMPDSDTALKRIETAVHLK